MGRRQAEALMTSTCTVDVVSGETVNENGEVVPVTENVYSGKCRLRWPTATSAEVNSGGQIMTVQTPELMLPVEASAGVEVGQVATITANPLDPESVGLRLRIRGLHFQTHSTARRLQVEVEL
jgi:hypothetical protein